MRGEKHQQEDGKADRGGVENSDRLGSKKSKKRRFHKKAVTHREKDNMGVRKFASTGLPLSSPNRTRDRKGGLCVNGLLCGDNIKKNFIQTDCNKFLVAFKNKNDIYI